jgi:hypothetical protein
MKSMLVSRVALTLATLLFGTFVSVSPGHAQQAQRIKGTITHVDGDKLTLKVSGKPLVVTLATDATVTSVVAAKLSDIKPGRFVGTAARPEANGHSRAIEVHIFPVGSRLGEGHRPWDPEPGATMTNADVTAAVAHARNGVLTLTTGGQSYDIDVPPGTPIVAMSQGTRALVKKGAQVSINQAVPAADGTFTAKSITVSKVHNWPPK